MSTLVYVLTSILLITTLAALGRKAGLRVLCPICAGVALTWMGLLGLRTFGIPVGDTLTALLMGASVVGGLQALERRLPENETAPLWWKTAFVLAGISAGFALIELNWPLEAGAAVVLAALAGWMLWNPRSKSGPVPTRASGIEALTEQMKNCC